MSSKTYRRAGRETLADHMGIPRELNEVMEFDCPIRVHGNGRVTFLPGDAPFEPSLYLYADGQEEMDAVPWEPLTGFTGQYGYSGPVMHPSETISGGLARYILDTPGLYVAVVVNALDDDGEQADEPAGWAVFTIRDETWEG